MTMPENSAVGSAAEKSDAQTAETCVACGRLLIPRGPNGECLRCLGSFAFAPESEPSMMTPPSYAHFEVEVGADGHPVELRAGAMGVTYLARDTILECTVALKVIDTQRAGNPAARTRFLREARAAARLHHPNVARVTYYGEQDDECFYVMEFVEGETLEERVRREGPLAPTLALDIAVQTARALAAAESCGVIHRDLKPSNLMIASRQGESEISDSLLVKVIDFGIAKITETGIDQTQAGFIGTPTYASPEQFTGSGEAPVDTRSDIYSLGITLWYLISGRAPFVGRTLEEIQKKQSDELPLEQLRMASVPDKMIGLLKSMLAVDPGDRPQSARELLAAIQRCRKEEDDEPAMIEAALRREEGFWTAVLPFKFSGDPEIAGFAEGLTEEIVTGMARFPYLRVITPSLTTRSPSLLSFAESATNLAPATCWRAACDRRETSFVSLCNWWTPARERTFGPRPSIVSGKRRKSSICRTKSLIASSARLPMCMACLLVRSPRPRPKSRRKLSRPTKLSGGSFSPSSEAARKITCLRALRSRTPSSFSRATLKPGRHWPFCLSMNIGTSSTLGQIPWRGPCSQQSAPSMPILPVKWPTTPSPWRNISAAIWALFARRPNVRWP
jgi:serine/threonine protein kinase